MPDPTQDEVRGEGEDREKRASDRSSPKEDLADLAVNTSETELLSDIFGLDLRREGGQYKITPHNPNASLTELLNSPVPSPTPPTPPTAPPPELRRRHQVILCCCFVIFSMFSLLLSFSISSVSSFDHKPKMKAPRGKVRGP